MTKVGIEVYLFSANSWPWLTNAMLATDTEPIRDQSPSDMWTRPKDELLCLGQQITEGNTAFSTSTVTLEWLPPPSSHSASAGNPFSRLRYECYDTLILETWLANSDISSLLDYSQLEGHGRYEGTSVSSWSTGLRQHVREASFCLQRGQLKCTMHILN